MSPDAAPTTSQKRCGRPWIRQNTALSRERRPVFGEKFAMAARTTSQKPRGPSYQMAKEALSRATSSDQP
jgi:hypothetical protein